MSSGFYTRWIEEAKEMLSRELTPDCRQQWERRLALYEARAAEFDAVSEEAKSLLETSAD